MVPRSYLSALIFVLVTAPALATQITEVPLSKQVADADVIVVGHVDMVSMHGYFGQKIFDPDARTGPRIPNELRLHVTLDPHRILKGKLPSARIKYVLPLLKMWHNTLADAQSYYEEYEKGLRVFFLTSEMKPSDIASFVHFESEVPEIQRLVRTHSQK